MIPRASITFWRENAPWSSDAYVEQDLVLSRAIVEIFSDPYLQDHLAFRGGTALHKLLFRSHARYSEDIDLVQRESGAIGRAINAIRERLDGWLGKPKWELSKANAALIYRFQSEIAPVEPLRLKIEINTREHFAVLGYRKQEFSVESPWFSGRAQTTTYALEELAGTKLRALYQRKKGRDLFDLDYVLRNAPEIDVDKAIGCFYAYLTREKLQVSRAQFEASMAEKMRSAGFRADIGSLLRTETKFEAESAYARVHEGIISKLSGDPWKGEGAKRKSR